MTGKFPRIAAIPLLSLLTFATSAAVLVGSAGSVETAGQVAASGETTTPSGARLVLTGPSYGLPAPTSSGAKIVPVIVPPAGGEPVVIEMDGFLIR